jgi:tetratricopeptide (TPR) repeat protein
MKSLVAALLLAAVPAAPALAQAPRPAPTDLKAQARAHYDRGAGFYKQARYREAIAEFQEAYRLRPHGVIHFNLAQCYERLGDIPAALQAYHEYLRAVPDAEDRRTVVAAMANLEARLGASGVQQLLVYSDPSGAEVRVDGQSRGRTPLALVLPHGSHTVSLEKPGYRTSTRQAVLSSQVSVEMDVALQKDVPLPPPPVISAPAGTVPPGPAVSRSVPSSATSPAPHPVTPGPRPRLWTWVAAGTAAAVLGAGVYYGVEAKKAQDNLRGNVHDSGTATQLAKDAKSKARTANVLYGVGGVAAAGAGALFYFEGSF